MIINPKLILQKIIHTQKNSLTKIIMQAQQIQAAPCANSHQSNQKMASCCYYFSTHMDKNILPIIKNHYSVQITNKFAEIQSIQTYKNPLDKNLEIHYAIPVDPAFVLANLLVTYQGATLEGFVKERQKVSAEFKQANQKGETVIMAVQQKNQTSVLNIKIGNIAPFQTVQIQFTLIGQLKNQLQNQWTLRIPSHIGPRYHTQTDAIQRMFQNLTQHDPTTKQAYFDAKTQWDFQIRLVCSQKIASYMSSSHKLKCSIISQKQYIFQMNGEKVSEVDLQFTYSHSKPQTTFCTLGNKCAAVTFCTAPSQKVNFDTLKGEYIFLLDRSGSMTGTKMKQAKQALVLFLLSLPEDSYFNIVSFGSSFEKMYPKSQKYSKSTLKLTTENIQKFDANLGGTEIAKPLQEIKEQLCSKQNTKQGYQSHIIVLTDGQVSNVNQVIQIIKKMNSQKISTTHMVGIGNGISYDMIQNGAKQGGGYSLFIMKSEELKRQIIFLLQSITSARIKNFKIIVSNDELVDKDSIIIPKAIVKGRQTTIFMNLKKQIMPEELKGHTIQLQYEDEDQNYATVHHSVSIQPNVISENLHKLKAYLEIQSLISNGQIVNKKKAIQKSIEQQVLCKYTGFICRIKQSLIPIALIQQQLTVKQTYLLKIQNALQGKSTLKISYITVTLFTLTGKTIQISVPQDITVDDYKYLIQQKQGIPAGQQRIVYAGKQLQSGRNFEDYGIDDGAIVHLVLRLRGGDGGGVAQKTSVAINFLTLDVLSKQKNKLFTLSIQNQKVSKVDIIYDRIYEKYPQLEEIPFTITSSQNLLQRGKLLSSYLINPSKVQIQISLQSFYIDLLKNILNLMHIQGFWQHDPKLLSKLNIQAQYLKHLQQYNNIPNLAMTKSIVQFVIRKFPKQREQFSLIIKKVNKFLKNNPKSDKN